MGKYLPLLALLLFLSGCSCQRYTYGYIVDFNDHKPIYQAEVYSFAALDDEIKDERIVRTDSTGWFETAFSINSIAKCGNLKLIITKPGYQPAYIIDLPPGDTVFLLKDLP